MQVTSFESRLEPTLTFGVVPKECLTNLCMVGLFAAGAIMMPMILVKVIFVVLVVTFGTLLIGDWRHYKDARIMASKQAGSRNRRLKTFGRNTNLDSSLYWRSQIDKTGMVHYDNAVSIAFIWDGDINEYAENTEFEAAHKNRVAITRVLSGYPCELNLCVEHHFLRVNDASLVNTYLSHSNKTNPSAPAIVRDIKNQIAEKYRYGARSNTVLTVISVDSKKSQGLIRLVLSLIFPSSWSKLSDCMASYEKSREVFKDLQNLYPGARLLSSDEYHNRIHSIYNPFNRPHDVNWRFNYNEQYFFKPVTEVDNCLKIGDTYYKTLILSSYETQMSHAWFFSLCFAQIGVHISQIIKPKSTRKALDDSFNDSIFSNEMGSDKKGVDILNQSLNDSASYREYVSKRKIDVADNAFIITLFSEDLNHVKESFASYQSQVISAGGLVRDDIDMQRDMIFTRLPGMGRYSTFLREDHADTIAVQMPFTTENTGTKEPECLWQTMNGGLVGTSPSKLEVAHELCVAETFGGKDTFMGKKIIETYHLIRYDIIEIGNSYQGLIEAIGGIYCQAESTIINPLCTYAEIEECRSKDNTGNSYHTLIANQISVLTPVFKGFSGGLFTPEDEVVIGRVLNQVFKSPSEKKAPILPDLIPMFDLIDCDLPGLSESAAVLKSKLAIFLETPEGRCFRKQDQFVISPIANAIDFQGLDGRMFDYFITFTLLRLANNAMASGARSQIILNEYKLLLEKAPEPVTLVSLIIDRMGRKERVGLTRNSQGLIEIKNVDPESINSIPNRSILSRTDNHAALGADLGLPSTAIAQWMDFVKPESPRLINDPHRQAFIYENRQLHHIKLALPELLIDLMNTKGEEKDARLAAYKMSDDPYERIKITKRLVDEQKQKESNYGRT